MRQVETQVLVIGGGATGTGIIRDLAMRELDAILVEKRDLAHGTTGRYHGLLHSGGRYAVKDPQTAAECIQENQILRRIMPHCIEDTGGFFVTTPWDTPDYGDEFVAGCLRAHIPVEEISIGQMLRQEPFLNPKISRCFRVPDGTADSFLAARANVESARQSGAQVWTYHRVINLLKQGDRIVGALCHDLVNDEQVTVHAQMVVNAAGAWAGLVAATAGLQVPVRCGKGTMVAMHHRLLGTVVNRCRPSADGDVIVPTHTVAVIGTTDEKVDDPERFAVEPWEIRLMLEEGDRLVPGIKDMRVLRVWAGVRPLYAASPTETTSDRDVGRSHMLLDHETRDGMVGMVTMIGGKWTTYRLMAQETVDRVCEKLGCNRPCRTHLEPVSGAEAAHTHQLAAPLAHVEDEATYSQLVCECELATREQIERAIVEGEARTVDDIRRDTRLGMGTCQGGFCTYRAVGLWHQLRRPPVAETNVALRDFLQERWKGLLPALAGQQMRQERFNEMIYLDLLNADHLAGERASRLGCVMYQTETTPGEVHED